MNSPSPARRDGVATRQRLIRAAVDLYTTVGFRAATTPEIAARAGVAEGTIYRHFSGKEDLLNEVYREVQRWGVDLLEEPDGEKALSPVERLNTVARRLISAAEGEPGMVRMLLQRREERHLDEQSREAGREFLEAMQLIVAAGKSDGLVRSGPAELWTAVWLALVAFAAERVSAREWQPDHPQVALTLEAAWDAISNAGKGKT